jgi:hypothetical protein
MYELHQILWDIRRDPQLAEKFLDDPIPILDHYKITGEAREALINFDFAKLHEIGANPYLIYFCAIQLKFDRAAYYAQIRGEGT